MKSRTIDIYVTLETYSHGERSSQPLCEQLFALALKACLTYDNRISLKGRMK